MATKEINFKVHHVARIEGHGNIIVNAKDGKIELQGEHKKKVQKALDEMGFKTEVR